MPLAPAPAWLPLAWDIAQRLAKLIREGRQRVSLDEVVTAEEQRSLRRAVEREQKRRSLAAKR